MKQKHLFWGAAVVLTFLFSTSAIAQPRHAKKKVKKVVETKVDVCPFTDKWVEDETKFEDRKEKAMGYRQACLVKGKITVQY